MIFRGGPPYLFTMTWWFQEIGHLLKCNLMIFFVLVNFSITLPSINWGGPPLRTTSLVATLWDTLYLIKFTNQKDFKAFWHLLKKGQKIHTTKCYGLPKRKIYRLSFQVSTWSWRYDKKLLHTLKMNKKKKKYHSLTKNK